MQKYQIIPLVLAFTAGSALSQQIPEFTQADANSDGVLSISELAAALPTLIVEDTNGDGMVNKAEVEAALPGLMLAPGGEENRDALVGESDYLQIVSVIHVDGFRDDS